MAVTWARSPKSEEKAGPTVESGPTALASATATDYPTAVASATAKADPTATASATAKPVAYADEDCVDTADLPPSIQSWEDPSYIGLYLILGDEIENELVAYLLRLGHEIGGRLRRSAGCEDAEMAKTWFGDAVEMTRGLIKTVNSLDRYRNGGIQRVDTLRTQGIQVGLTEKLKGLMKPKPGSPEALLCEFIANVADMYEATAGYFKRAAYGVEVHCGDEQFCLRAKAYGQSVPTHKEAGDWRRLEARARTQQANLFELLTELPARRRQVTVVEETTIGSAKSGASNTDRPGRLRRVV